MSDLRGFNKKFMLKNKLEPYEIRLMEYGIVNSFNFSSIDKIPIKRWDPLSASFITMDRGGIPIILSKKYGHFSYISPIRGKRPLKQVDMDKHQDVLSHPEEKVARNSPIDKEKKTIGDNKDLQPSNIADHKPIDIFEPMINGHHYIDPETEKIMPAYSIIIADGSEPLDNPFSMEVRTYPNLKGNAITMINKYPAMVRVIEPELYPYIQNSLYEIDKNSRIAEGVCFLTFPRLYHESISDLHHDEFSDLMKSLIASIKYTISEAKKKRNIEYIPISPFFNIGKLVGGSIPRLHAQVYMDLSQDGHGSRMESILKSFEMMQKSGKCHLCHSKHGEGERVIIQTNDWVVFASASPIRNYHLRFAPQAHRCHIAELKDSEITSLGKILRVISLVMDDMKITKNRNIIFNTKPSGYDSYFHVFGDILPYEFIGGAELADSMRVVRISPKKVAIEMRRLINSKYLDLL